MRTVIGYLRSGLQAAVLASLFTPALSGCAHTSPDQARHHSMVAAHAHAHAPSDQISAHARDDTLPFARVDLSELPRVTEEAPASRSFAPGPLLAAPEIASWIDSADSPESISMLELRNACALDFRYAFAADSQPDGAQLQRPLAARSLQTQEIPTGYWLHLWRDGRWLGAATTLAEAGVLELSSDCETLEIQVETPEGSAMFAIHWELDAALTALTPAQTPDSIELDLDLEPTPELWGSELAEQGGHIELRLLNLCAEPTHYAFTPELGDEPMHSSTLPGHSERIVEVPATWWLQYQLLDEGWRGGATTSESGSTLWFAPNCISYGIGDGEVIGNF